MILPERLTELMGSIRLHQASTPFVTHYTLKANGDGTYHSGMQGRNSSTHHAMFEVFEAANEVMSTLFVPW
jgi:hypothetical protein